MAIQYGIPKDPDVFNYFRTANITDPNAMKQIALFVKEIKKLGLWNSMVCWPLRSSQNAGTGTTAYSLGGLGAYNGTLTGSSLPTWGLNGINFLPSVSSRITASLAISQPFSVYGCLSFGALANAGSLFSGGSASNAQMYNFSNSAKIEAAAGATLVSTSSYSANIKFFTTAYFNGSSSIIGINNSTNNGNVGSGGISSLTIGNNFNINYAGKDIEISFFMLISNIGISSSIYSLYKSTLGQGLGLP